ncbi:MAG: hypothetical protein V1799_15830 [bacterium]
MLFLMVGSGSPTPSRSPHNPGANCLQCHPHLKIGGTIYSDSTGRTIQSGVAVSLLSPNGMLSVLDRSDNNGNIAASLIDDGVYRITIGSATSRTWHAIPHQSGCNTCHSAGGNTSSTRTAVFPKYHTSIPSDNECTHCYHFPATQSLTHLISSGVLSGRSQALPIPGSKVEMPGLPSSGIVFTPSEYKIISARPDIFAQGYFSMFDVILAVAARNSIQTVELWKSHGKPHVYQCSGNGTQYAFIGLSISLFKTVCARSG